MGGLIRPVGPEPAETYWRRRALVLGAMLMLVIIVLVFWINAGNSPGQAAATGPTGSGPAAAGTPTPTPAMVTTTPSLTPSALPSDAGSPSASAGPAASMRPSASGMATPTASTSVNAKATSASAGPTHSASARATTATGRGAARPTACRGPDLRVTLRGDHRRVPVKSAVHFQLSVINGSATSCRMVINSHDFELRVTSGVDRIWSSDDCPRLVPDLATVIGPERDLGWTMTWGGRRSRPGGTCASRPETPGPGYYHATARLAGARPVSFLLVLT